MKSFSRLLAPTLIVIWSLPDVAAGTPPDELRAVAQQIAEQITAKPQIRSDMYGAEFRRAVPDERIVDIYKAFFQQYGAVLHIAPHKENTATSGKFTFFWKDVEMPVSLSIEAAAPHRVASLWFGPPTPRLKSLDEVTARLAKLPGQMSYQLERLDDGKVLQLLNPDTPLAIGSAFKLYILATLVEERAPWDKVVKLEARHKSLPGGEMQDWPDGAPVTVHTLALKMISISDNTATDHLLAVAGREEVEKRLAGLGMKDPQRDMPFLSTREMFQLKNDAEVRKKYLAAGLAGRRALLAELDDKPLPTLAQVLAWKGPIAIDQIEWFASAADLCRIVQWYDKQADPTALAILAVNPGLHPAADKFTYIGFKGGSETGVLNMTWLLHSQSGRHYALSASWNNPAEDVDLLQFSGLMLAVMDLLESPPSEKPAAK